MLHRSPKSGRASGVALRIALSGNLHSCEKDITTNPTLLSMRAAVILLALLQQDGCHAAHSNATAVRRQKSGTDYLP